MMSDSVWLRARRAFLPFYWFLAQPELNGPFA